MSSVKRVISPQEWVDRQIDTLKSVGKKNYLIGIASPKANPIERGIETEGKFKEAMEKALANESRKKGLQKTSMEEWYMYARDLGADKLVAGVEKRKAKVQKFVTAWHPILSTHLGKLDALAEETDSDRETKMLENLRGLKALKGSA